jgi:hypothetical protein
MKRYIIYFNKLYVAGDMSVSVPARQHDPIAKLSNEESDFLKQNYLEVMEANDLMFKYYVLTESVEPYIKMMYIL